jgi:hypothetical protein
VVETHSPVDAILAERGAKHVNVNLLRYFNEPATRTSTRLVCRLSTRCRGGARSASTTPGFSHFPELAKDQFPHTRYNRYARIP